MTDRIKKLSFRASHRGMKELDVIMGRYAETHLAEMSGDELDQFERILGAPDPSVYAWLTGTEEIPAEYDGPVLRQIMRFSLTPADYTATKDT